MPSFCGDCGTEAAGSKFCTGCGAKLPDSGAAGASAAQSGPAAAAAVAPAVAAAAPTAANAPPTAAETKTPHIDPDVTDDVSSWWYSFNERGEKNAGWIQNADFAKLLVRFGGKCKADLRQITDVVISNDHDTVTQGDWQDFLARFGSKPEEALAKVCSLVCEPGPKGQLVICDWFVGALDKHEAEKALMEPGRKRPWLVRLPFGKERGSFVKDMAGKFCIDGRSGPRMRHEICSADKLYAMLDMMGFKRD
eukprot:g79114.t1